MIPTFGEIVLCRFQQHVKANTDRVPGVQWQGPGSEPAAFPEKGLPWSVVAPVMNVNNR